MMSQDEIRYLDMTEEASILAIEPPNAVDVTEPTTTQATATIAPTTPLTRSTTPMPTLDITTQFPAITTEMMTTTTSWPQDLQQPIATTITTTTTTTTERTDPFQHRIDFSVHSGDAGSSNITMPNAVIVVVVPKTEGTLVLTTTTITPKATPPPSQKMYSKVIIKFKISNFMHCYFFCPLNNFFCLSAELANQQRPPHFNYFS